MRHHAIQSHTLTYMSGGAGTGAVGGSAPQPKQLQLREWDPQVHMPLDCTVLLLGMRGSGKTLFMRYILWSIRKKLDTAVVFCPTQDTRAMYEECIPRCFVHEHLCHKRLAEVYDAQKQISAVHKGDKSKFRSLGIILDDCGFDKSEFSTPVMRAILMNSRHEKVFFMTAAQYAVSVPKDQRNNIDIVIVFPCADVRTYFDNFFVGVFDNAEQLAHVFQHAIRPHECLVLDNRAFRTKQPHLFYCKAPEHIQPFRLGCDHFWEMYYRYMVRAAKHDASAEIAAALDLAKGKLIDDTDVTTALKKQAADDGVVIGKNLAVKRVPIVRGPGLPKKPKKIKKPDTGTPDMHKLKLRTLSVV